MRGSKAALESWPKPQQEVNIYIIFIVTFTSIFNAKPTCRPFNCMRRSGERNLVCGEDVYRAATVSHNICNLSE